MVQFGAGGKSQEIVGETVKMTKKLEENFQSVGYIANCTFPFVSCEGAEHQLSVRLALKPAKTVKH